MKGKLTLFFIYLSEGRALDVFDCAKFLGQLFSHFQGQRLLLVLGQLLDGGRIVSQIDLGADQQERGLLAVVCDLRYPLQTKKFYVITMGLKKGCWKK